MAGRRPLRQDSIAARLPSRERYRQSIPSQRQSSFTEVMGATIEQSAQFMSHNIAGRTMDRWRAEREGDKQLSVEELSERFDFKQMTRPFAEPMTLEAAETIFERQQRDKKLNEIIANGPDGLAGAATKASSFIAGMVPHLFDVPANLLGAGAVKMGAMAGRSAAMALNAGKAAKGTRAATQGQKSLAREMTDAGVANLGLEPFYHYTAQQDLMDYGLVDSLMNVAGGSVGVVGLQRGIPWLVNRVKNTPKAVSETQSLGPEGAAAVQHTAVAQMADGKQVNPAPIADDIRRPTKEASHNPNVRARGEHNNTRQPGAEPEFDTRIFSQSYIQSRSQGAETSYMGRDFFAPRYHKSGEGANVSRNSMPVDQNWGEGLYLTDSAAEITKTTSRDKSALPKRVNITHLDQDINLLQMNDPSDIRLRSSAEKVMRDAKVSDDVIQRTLREDATNQEIFNVVESLGRADMVDYDPVRFLNRELSVDGLDGIQGPVSGQNMNEGASQIMLFPDKDARMRSVEDIDPPRVQDKEVPVNTIEYAKRINNKENSLEYRPEHEQANQLADMEATDIDTSPEMHSTKRLRQAEKELKELRDQAEELDAAGMLDDDARQTIAQVDENLQKVDKLSEAHRALANCLTRGA